MLKSLFIEMIGILGASFSLIKKHVTGIKEEEQACCGISLYFIITSVKYDIMWYMEIMLNNFRIFQDSSELKDIGILAYMSERLPEGENSSEISRQFSF